MSVEVVRHFKVGLKQRRHFKSGFKVALLLQVYDRPEGNFIDYSQLPVFFFFFFLIN